MLPAIIAARNDSGISKILLRNGKVIHAHVLANAPTYNWPSTPILNTPPLNAIATARPANNNGVIHRSELLIPPSVSIDDFANM